MKAAGGPENFSIETRPVPEPGKGQVLVKVKAFGLNRSELMTRKGFSPNVSFPRILGIECVGEIVADPSGEFQPGQKVAGVMGEMGRAFEGSYAEYTVLPKEIVLPFDSNLEWAVLGAIPEMFHTVWGSVHLALQIEKSETILIRRYFFNWYACNTACKKKWIDCIGNHEKAGKKRTAFKNWC